MSDLPKCACGSDNLMFNTFNGAVRSVEAVCLDCGNRKASGTRIGAISLLKNEDDELWKCEVCGKWYTEEEGRNLEWIDGFRCSAFADDNGKPCMCGGIVSSIAANHSFQLTSPVQGHDDRGTNFHPTPAWVTEALMMRFPPPKGLPILCPMAGDGAIVRVLLKHGYEVYANEIVKKGAMNLFEIHLMVMRSNLRTFTPDEMEGNFPDPSHVSYDKRRVSKVWNLDWFKHWQDIVKAIPKPFGIIENPPWDAGRPEEPGLGPRSLASFLSLIPPPNITNNEHGCTYLAAHFSWETPCKATFNRIWRPPTHPGVPLVGRPQYDPGRNGTGRSEAAWFGWEHRPRPYDLPGPNPVSKKEVIQWVDNGYQDAA